ncbi:hypothetical protein ACFSC4_27100 [Deinococcus malanensis]|uniref:hypothetical protein n=1 Tax=Deinococcus malanensis TaxID=1706855 RepID=UPI001669FDBF|nr:hypothetical protein [Deinococcus malanensis]
MNPYLGRYVDHHAYEAHLARQLHDAEIRRTLRRPPPRTRLATALRDLAARLES